MNDQKAMTGFGERTQEPFEHIPTDVEAFLSWGTHQSREAGRFELSQGRVWARPYGETRVHARIRMNIFAALVQRLGSERFAVGVSDFAVRTGVGVRSPDLLVEPARQPLSALASDNPILVAEVVSPASASIDFTEKLAEYTAIPSVQTYLICSQDEPRAWVWARQGDGAWPPLPLELAGREGAIPLGGLGIEITMAAIFRGIPDPPTLD